MEILIGRESAHSRLSVVVDQKAKVFGNEGSVPSSVSRRHCIINFDSNSGKMRITNLNPNNCTAVNGMAIESFCIKDGDRIDLGKDCYRLSWETLNQVINDATPAKAVEADIRGLEEVWANYSRQNNSLTQSQTLTNVLRGGIPIITIGAVMAGLMYKDVISQNPAIMITVYAVVLTILLVLFIKSVVDSRRIPKKREKLNKLMMHKYTCPNCGYYFGNNSYDIIRINTDNCPKCRAKLIK